MCLYYQSDRQPYLTVGFPGGTSGKEPARHCTDMRDLGSIPGSGRSPGEGHANPLQYSCLKNPMDRGAWRASVDRVAELDMTETTYEAR